LRTLRRLGTDWIDVYYVHAWDPVTPLDETLSALDCLVRSGKVRYLGVSNFFGWQIAKAMGRATFHGPGTHRVLSQPGRVTDLIMRRHR
jgi:aryl-alcohol dehydrogenase-like predicted oxidoreductase